MGVATIRHQDIPRPRRISTEGLPARRLGAHKLVQAPAPGVVAGMNASISQGSIPN